MGSLASFTLEDARRRGWAVRVLCPFVTSWVGLIGPVAVAGEVALIGPVAVAGEVALIGPVAVAGEVALVRDWGGRAGSGSDTGRTGRADWSGG